MAVWYRITGIALFLAGFLGSPDSRAAHLVGGEISYRCLGNNDYEITLIVYRDGFSMGAAFDPQAIITIYNDNNIMVLNRAVDLGGVRVLPLAAPNNCTNLPNNVKTERGIYRDTVNLPPVAGGYVITHQRCCRNSTIANVNNPNTWGNTYTVRIPSMDNCNSSPHFTTDPPVVLCVNQPVDLDLGAAEPDGDSLHYQLCEMLHGGNSQTMPLPNPANPPPYVPVPFRNGFSVQNPIPGNPPFQIDPQTGALSGRPTQVGQFVFAICVTEYRNGVLLSQVRRDFQFNVSNDCNVILSMIRDPDGQTLAYQDTVTALQNPVSLCKGTAINFISRSQNSSKYFWDFGDTTTAADTSRLANPLYQYQDTGSYLVMHVAEPYSICADTSFALYKIFDSTSVEFSFSGEYCLDRNSVNFSVSGDFSTQSQFEWDFGPDAAPGQPTDQQAPHGVTWLSPGAHYVKVTITDFGCMDEFGDTVYIYQNLEIDEVVEPVHECAPYQVHFEDNSVTEGRIQHFWFFGDGHFSNKANPSHTYREPGIYTVEHVIRSFDGCKDSAYSRYEDVINIYPVPQSRLEYSSKQQDILNPVFHLTNRSEGANSTLSLLPDGRQITDLESETLELNDSGNYEIVHISFNEFGCSDTLRDTLRVHAPFRIYTPNAFTPDGDGVNEEWFFTATDVRKAHLEIRNRWGEVVRRSNSLNATWNGRLHNTGPPLPEGSYSFILILDVKTGAYQHVESGVIQLMRRSGP